MESDCGLLALGTGTGTQVQEPSSWNPKKEQRTLSGLGGPATAWESAPMDSAPSGAIHRPDVWFPLHIWGFGQGAGAGPQVWGGGQPG